MAKRTSLDFPKFSILYKDRLYYKAEVVGPGDNKDIPPQIGRIDFLDNKHQVSAVIEEFKCCGRIKNCSHLSVKTDLRTGSCYPDCAERSLIWKRYPNFHPPHIEEVMLGCDEKCRYFLPKWKHALREKVSQIGKQIKQVIYFLWYSFDKQHVWVKILLLLVVLAYFMPDILEEVGDFVSRLPQK